MKGFLNTLVVAIAMVTGVSHAAGGLDQRNVTYVPGVDTELDCVYVVGSGFHAVTLTELDGVFTSDVHNGVRYDCVFAQAVYNKSVSSLYVYNVNNTAGIQFDMIGDDKFVVVRAVNNIPYSGKN